MQGTVVMLIALSGLGCHHKSCDVAYAPPSFSCFGGGCYANVYPSYVAPGDFSGCYTSCYTGCYSACYSSFAKLFSCCGSKGYGYGHALGYDDTFVSRGYDLPYEPPIFGYALQYNYGASDPYAAPSPPPSAMPSEAAPPIAPNPVPTMPKPPTPAPTVVPSTPPPPPVPADIPAPKPVEIPTPKT